MTSDSQEKNVSHLKRLKKTTTTKKKQTKNLTKVNDQFLSMVTL